MIHTCIDELTINLVRTKTQSWDKKNQKYVDLDKPLITKTKVFELGEKQSTDFMKAYEMVRQVATIHDICESKEKSLEVIMNFDADIF